MNSTSQVGQHPDQVVQSVVNQIRRAIKKPATRIWMMKILKPYMHSGHGDINGEELVFALHNMARSRTFYREPAGEKYAGEVVTTPEIAYSLGGDCDDMAVLIGTGAAVFGCEVAIGRTMDTKGNAHIVAAVRPGWYIEDDWVVIDPQKENPTEPSIGSRWVGV